MKKTFIPLGVFVLLLYLLHCTPELALRTHLALIGYPGKAFTTDFEVDDLHVDAERLAADNTAIYIVNSPPIERTTQGDLRIFSVTKHFGFFYSASFYGDT
ncbi:hypothetical protein JOC54_000470 [Alkalihalobacillus xiaoxiensis]|uniref:Uncharacterized protein n=1 Tax=Shouchella xiaoxiensis TaxID=766895 RepID=A0ABS2SNZ1_9BACI|nr:hypothetical protein [Shouchella xiaoxiensis]MBM7837239.1 hypothetical protein [Shouchella xiaoxiensis]